MSSTFSLSNAVNFKLVFYLRRGFLCKYFVLIEIYLVEGFLVCGLLCLLFSLRDCMLDGVVEIINCVEVKTTVFPTHNQQVFNKVEVSDRGGELIWLILHKNMVMRVEDCWETDNSAFIGSEEVPQF